MPPSPQGVVMGMKHAAPVMKRQGGGVILSTASVAGLGAGYGPHVYSQRRLRRRGEADPGLTAGAWTHPDFGAGLLDAIAEVLGVDDFSKIDAVYHARR